MLETDVISWKFAIFHVANEIKLLARIFEGDKLLRIMIGKRININPTSINVLHNSARPNPIKHSNVTPVKSIYRQIHIGLWKCKSRF